MKKRPIIGLVPLYDRERDSHWMLPGYPEGVMAAGGLPVTFPLTGERELLEQLAEQCDGFLFTGGQDVAPEMYGEIPLSLCGETCPALDEMEGQLLALALERDKPVLGICRGLQFLNAALGGTLYQDLPAQRPSGVVHRQKKPYDLPAHGVVLEEGSPLRRLLGKKRLRVNSCHHQGVRDLAPALRAMARAEDGLVEAAHLPGRRWVWAVQWHPECSFRRDEDSLALFRAFAMAAGEK